MAQSFYHDEISRKKAIDEKFNFILVFIAAIITGFNVIFPYSNNYSIQRKTISNVLIVELLFLIIVTIFLVIVGMIPRGNLSISEEIFTDMDFILQESKKVYGGYIKGLQDSIKSFHKTNEKKATFLKAAFLLSVVDFSFYAALLIIKFC